MAWIFAVRRRIDLASESAAVDAVEEGVENIDSLRARLVLGDVGELASACAAFGDEDVEWLYFVWDQTVFVLGASHARQSDNLKKEVAYKYSCVEEEDQSWTVVPD